MLIFHMEVVDCRTSENVVPGEDYRIAHIDDRHTNNYNFAFTLDQSVRVSELLILKLCLKLMQK